MQAVRMLSRIVGAAFAVAVVALLLGAGLYAVGDAVLADTPVAEDPAFVNTLFASRAVVASIRLAIVFAAAYIVVSVIALIAKGRWLNRVGPVEATEPVADLEAENAYLRDGLAGAGQAIEYLEAELEETNELLAAVLEIDTIDEDESEAQ